jgi:hypothetical protein
MPQNKNFKELQAKWYAKLKKTGFNDIESHTQNDDNPDGSLKEWHSQRFYINNRVEDFKQKERYYQLATQFTYDYKFNDEQDKIIWDLHANGSSVREISKQLNKKGYDRTSVHKVIKKLRNVLFQLHGIKK